MRLFKSHNFRLLGCYLSRKNLFLYETFKEFKICNPFINFVRYCSKINSFDLKNPALIKYIEELEKQIENNEVGNTGRSKEKIYIVNNLINKISFTQNNINSLNELRNASSEDEAFNDSINKELKEHEQILHNIEDDIITELIPEDEKENCDAIIIEVTAGVGGQEAMLFAQNIFELYRKYIKFKGWKYELSDFLDSELGGLRHGSMIISGKNCYKLFRYESGVHRVQRIPKTERTGRMHTSTATVAILPQPSEVEVIIHDKDLKIETKTARGPGGQHVNKIETAVRIHHLPTGFIIECQVHKSQYQNKQLAMQKLRSKLYEMESDQSNSKMRNLRKFQIGSASRNEKVRTYNFPQDRITDHRFNKTIHNLERYFEGSEHFDEFLNSLLEIHFINEKKQFLETLQSKYG